MQNILKQEKRRIALIVNDMGSINIDASILNKTGNQVSQIEMVEMQNGCICSTLRDEFLAEIERLSADRSIEAVFVEASGISEPSSIAGAFVNYDEVESYSSVQKTLNAHDEDKACVDEYGITSFVFEEKRPFNREKFNRLVEEYPEKLIRSKGYIWFSDDWEHVIWC